jgi:hypothetical protein
VFLLNNSLTASQIQWKFTKSVNPVYMSKILDMLFVLINFAMLNALLKHNKRYEGE